MANVERVYTIPLGKVYSMRRNKRAKYAARLLKEFARRHMKSSEVRIGSSLNRRLLRDSMSSPPRKVKVTAVKDEAGVVRLNLFGARPDDDKIVAKAGEAAKKAESRKEEARKGEAEHAAHQKVLSEAERQAEKEAVKAEMKK